MCTPGPEPLIFLCQAGSKGKQKKNGDLEMVQWHRTLNVKACRSGGGGGREALKKHEVEKEALRGCCGRKDRRGSGGELPETASNTFNIYERTTALSSHHP